MGPYYLPHADEMQMLEEVSYDPDHEGPDRIAPLEEGSDQEDVARPAEESPSLSNQDAP